MGNSAFCGKSVIITGASRGIGRELALQLASCGARLTLAARSETLLAEVTKLCLKRGARAIYQVTDVSNQSQCLELIKKAVVTYGGIDMLINNAGVAMFSRFDSLSRFDAALSLFNTNFWGCVYCTHYALPYLKRSRGSIVSVNSGAGKFSVPTGSIYAASKHALVGFFNALRAELGKDCVTVTSVYLDWVATGITGRAFGSDGRPISNVHLREKGAVTPDICAGRILKAVAQRKREAFLSLRQRVGIVFSFFAPGFSDQMAVRELCIK